MTGGRTIMNGKIVWTAENKDTVIKFSDDYIRFLNNSKTERLCVRYSMRMAEKAGFVNIDSLDSVKPGDKVFKINRGKNIVLAIAGSDDILNGVNLVAAHIDSPRLDLKPNPLYEDSNLALFKTHYYGGIKKYQWTAIPLSMIGVVVLSDETVVDINIGEDEGDPKFTVTDLLPHLAKDQMSKKMSEVFTGEELNVLAGSIPADCEKDKFKQTVLDILKEKYNISEDDFVSAELEIVPSFPACTVGLDSSLVGSYGQDDRVCGYTALKAICDMSAPKRTSICFLADKEEIGSMGNTGMKGRFFENFLAELIYKMKGEYNDMFIRKALTASMCLSSDVTAGVDPTYKSVNEDNNSAFIGCGVAFCKYTGAHGKGSTSDANAEYVGKIRNIFNKAGVQWQICELGKVDQGGGGTVAQYIANLDVDTIDCGVPLLSMHAPFEIASKADVYSAYQGYLAFYKA